MNILHESWMCAYQEGSKNQFQRDVAGGGKDNTLTFLYIKSYRPEMFGYEEGTYKSTMKRY